AVIGDWTTFVYDGLGALHHFELEAPPARYGAFLLPSGLEFDLGFTPESHFGPRGPSFRLVFGRVKAEPGPPAVDADHLVGRGWHHVLHARMAIARAKPWQAEYWISTLRDHVIELICLRLGQPTAYAKGADSLPADVVAGLEGAL